MTSFALLGLTRRAHGDQNAKQFVRSSNRERFHSTKAKRSPEFQQKFKFSKQRFSLKIIKGSTISVLQTLPARKSSDEVYFVLFESLAFDPEDRTLYALDRIGFF